jgi:hypothetical protein
MSIPATNPADEESRSPDSFNNKMESFRSFDLALGLDIDGYKEKKNAQKQNKATLTIADEETTEEPTDSYEEEEIFRLRSAEDIRNYVRQTLPLEVKERISNETWDSIFEDVDEQDALEDETMNSGSLPIKLLRISNSEDVDDNISAVSEFSYPCESGRRRSKTANSRTYEDIAQERLQTCRRLASSDRWTAFENKGAKFKAADYGMGIAPPARPAASRILPPFKPRRQHSSQDMEEDESPVKHSPLKQPQRKTSVASSHQTKKVEFGTVQARFYEAIAEVNPSVSSGVAVGIGWMYKNGKVLPVDQWEAEKGGLVRSGRELVLPRRVRERMLLDGGFTQKDIAHATRMILKLKQQRKTTIEQLAAQQYAEDMFETAKRRIRNLLNIVGPRQRRESSASFSTTSASSSS